VDGKGLGRTDISLNKNFMKYTLTLIIITFLFGCEQQTRQNADIDKTSISFHKIILLDNYYAEYIQAAKADFSNLGKIYKEIIVEPILKKHFSKSEYFDR
jgi:hypothetical protein